MVDAVLFDMDGVVIDSEDYWPEHERDFLPGTVEDEPPALDDVKGMNVDEMYGYLAERHEMAVGKDEFLRMYDAAAEEIYRGPATMMDGFADLVGWLREQGLRVGIVTSSPRRWIDIIEEEFDVPPLDIFVSAEDIEAPGKPEPDIYLHAAEEVGADPSRCIAIEDSLNGTRAAARAGMFVIGYAAEERPDADVTVADPAALREELAARVVAGDRD